MTAWPGLPRADHDTRSPVKQPTVAALVNAGQHVRESAYDSATQLPDAPHVHSGADSVLIVMPDVPNLVVDAQPTTHAQNNVNEWKRTGVSVTGAGLLFRGAGHATHVLGDEGDTLQFAGCDLVIAAQMRTESQMSALTLRMGITDGHASTFVTGTMAEVSEAEIHAGGFRRFYTVIRNFNSTSGFSTDVRVGIAASGTYTPSGTPIDVTNIVVKPCSVLPQWEFGYYSPRNHDWELVGATNIPTWDEDANFRHALYLAPT